MPDYFVKQGDHLSSIAHDFGFTDFDPIWNHAQNADLKTLRVNPNVLLPNDKLFIPDLATKSYSRPTEKRHKFKVHLPKLKLRIKLVGMDKKPLANTKCKLELGKETLDVTSDATGLVEHPLSPEHTMARLVFTDPDFPFDVQIPIKIGHLDPIDSDTGQVARLNHLGYFLGDPDQPDPMDVKSAVEEFQKDQGLLVDGICGKGTQAKLKDLHGC